MSRTLPALAAGLVIASAAALSSLPAQASGIAWGLSIGVPGFSVYAGQPAYGWRAAPVLRPYASVFVPPVAFVPPRVVVAPPVVYRPVVRPWVRPVPVFRPYVYRRW